MDIRFALVQFLGFSAAFVIAWGHWYFFGMHRAMLVFSVLFIYFEYLALKPYLKRDE